MSYMKVSPLQEALECVQALPPEDQEMLVDIIHRQLVEKRRAEIARNAQVTLKSVREGKASFGSVEDLKRDLLDE